MATKEEVLATIQSLADEISAARQSIREGVIPEVRNAQARFEDCAQAVADLDPDDAVQVREPLQALLDDLQTLSDTISEIQARLAALDRSGDPESPGGTGPQG